MNSYSTIQPLHVSSRRAAESITRRGNAYHFNVSHIGRGAIHNRYLPCRDVVHHSQRAARGARSFLRVSQKKKKKRRGPRVVKFLPRPCGGINANETAEGETAASRRTCRWMNKPAGDDAFCLRALIGFLQTSCGPDSPLSTRGGATSNHEFRGPRRLRRYTLVCRRHCAEKSSLHYFPAYGGKSAR